MSRVYEVAFRDSYRKFSSMDLAGPVGAPTTYANRSTSRTAPSGPNVVNISNDDNGFIPNGVMFKPFARGTDGSTYTLNIYGWKNYVDVVGGSLTNLWCREILYQIVCTLSTTYSNTVGGPNFVLDTDEYFCSAITMASGFGVVNVDYYFQGLPVSIYMDTKSSKYLEIERMSNTGTVSTINAFFQLI